MDISVTTFNAKQLLFCIDVNMGLIYGVNLWRRGLLLDLGGHSYHDFQCKEAPLQYRRKYLSNIEEITAQSLVLKYQTEMKNQ